MTRIVFLPVLVTLLAGCVGGKEAAPVTTVTLEIAGMTCEKCEAHVREALESLPGVAVVSVSASEGTAVITTSRAHTEAEYRSVLTPEGKSLRKVTIESATP